MLEFDTLGPGGDYYRSRCALSIQHHFDKLSLIKNSLRTVIFVDGRTELSRFQWLVAAVKLFSRGTFQRVEVSLAQEG